MTMKSIRSEGGSNNHFDDLRMKTAEYVGTLLESPLGPLRKATLHAVTLCFLVMFVGCGSHLRPFTIEVSPKFKPDGHQYTTFLVAMFAGVEPVKADALTYYSQLPDLDCRFNAVPVAIWATFVPWRWNWRSDIEQALHSLHGGNNAEVQFRRKYVADLIRQRVRAGTSDNLIEAGLMIHALGDAYSHTVGEIGSGEEEAFGPLIGHGLRGGHPDEIARPDVFPKYAAFVRRLFEAMDGKVADRVRMEAYLKEMSAKVWNPKVEDFCTADDRMVDAIIKESTHIGGFNQIRYDRFVKSAGKLKSSIVQRVMDDINHGPVSLPER